MGKQADALKHVADAPPQLDRIELADILAADMHDPVGRLRQPVDQPQQRRLARARRSDQRKEFAGAHVERYVVERGPRRAVVDAGVLKRNGGILTHRFPPKLCNF